MKVRFKKLTPVAVTPYKAHPTDAAFDFTATAVGRDSNGNIVYNTGIAMEIPEGHVGLIFPRSSVCDKSLLLCNSVGVVDAHYRGEITAKFKPATPYTKKYTPGERVFQMIIMPYPEIELVEADTLTDTDRGTGGYGSTGK